MRPILLSLWTRLRRGGAASSSSRMIFASLGMRIIRRHLVFFGLLGYGIKKMLIESMDV